MKVLNRRDFLQNGLMAAGATLIGARYAFGASGQGGARLVCVILRGALDDLSAVPPVGDADYSRLRRELAIAPPGAADGALPLDATFGLNPGLKFLHESFAARELTVFHAVASPYRERSHFDGQDVLENGMGTAHASRSGWLNRAIAAMPRVARQRDGGVALGQNVPLLMRGPAAVASWSPSVLPSVDEETLQRIADRYAADSLLSSRFADALAMDALAETAQSPDEAPMRGDMAGANRATARGRTAAYTETVRTAAGFLRRDDGPAVAVFDTSGWDTHANQGSAQGQLTARLTALDQGLRTLKQSLGDVWSRTAVLVVTEFGRTAAANGTRGTDHGTGAAAFLLGGAVNGGAVRADWPGLSANALHQGRDLRPTTDLRSVFKGLLSEHLGVASAALERDVFPDSAAARPLRDLVRG